MYPDCRVLDLAAVRLSFHQLAVCSCASVTTLYYEVTGVRIKITLLVCFRCCRLNSVFHGPAQ